MKQVTQKRLPISVCMISGAEASRIGRALESVAGFASEIIVVLNEDVTDGTDRIAEQHGGRIAVTSKVGEGSCFTIMLPLDPASAA